MRWQGGQDGGIGAGLVRSQTLYPAELRAHFFQQSLLLCRPLPVWFPRPADPIQLSYGRISFPTAREQLTADSAFSSTATFCVTGKIIRGLAAADRRPRSAIRFHFFGKQLSTPAHRSAHARRDRKSQG